MLPIPMPVCWKRARREIAGCRLRVADCGSLRMSVLRNGLIQVEQHVGEVEPGGRLGSVDAGAKFVLADELLSRFGIIAIASFGLLIDGAQAGQLGGGRMTR